MIGPPFSRWGQGPWNLRRSDSALPRSAREQMIAETSAFLSWALAEGRRGGAKLPRIPRRRVDQGGFTMLLRMPGGRAAVARWWDQVLDRLA